MNHSPAHEVEATLFVCARDPALFAARIAALHELAGYELRPQATEHIRDIYFDTPERALQRSRYGLRVRRKNERWLLTLKGDATQTAAGVQRREREVGWSSVGLQAILDDLIALGVRITVRAATSEEEPLQAIRALGFEVIQDRETRRQIRHICSTDGQHVLAEFAIDACTYHLDGGAVRCYEIEIEQKSSDDSALSNTCDALCTQYANEVRVWRHSKLVTGFALEQLLQQQGREQVVQANGDLKSEYCDALDTILQSRDTD